METRSSLQKRKPAVKQDQIADELRSRIVRGRIELGGKLPTRRELQAEFTASLQTVQGALDRLAEEGFICVRGSLGTRVTDRPPHLCHYGIVLSGYPPAGTDAEQNFPRYWTAMVNEAKALERRSDRRCTAYYGIDGHTDTEDFQRLTRDIRSHRLAGLIFPANPFQLRGTPVLETPDLPRVAVMSGPPKRGLATVTLDADQLFARALDHLAHRGRRRIALMASTDRSHESFKAMAERRSLQVEPFWMQACPYTAPQFARNIVHLLMHRGQEPLPDGLFIADDNLAEYAVAGLIDAGVRAGVDLDVVAHCNFPWPTPSPVSVTRLGFDARQILQACIDSIDAQRRGGFTRSPILVAPVFESEIP